MIIFYIIATIAVVYFLLKTQEDKRIYNQEKMKEIFTYIYKKNIWGRGSGPGSYRECTVEYLTFLSNFINSYDIKSITDLGCGDWQMLKHFNFTNNIIYYGYDIVEDLIKMDKRLYGKDNINFYMLKSVDNMKKADLLIVKDVLIHWKNEIIIYFLKYIIIKYKYVILVNDFIKGKINIDINVGQFRGLNLEIAPFNYKQFNENIDMLFCKTLKRIYIKKNINIL